MSPPFLVRGVPVDELFPDARGGEGRPVTERAVGGDPDRRPVAETIADLDAHDDRIIEHLGGGAESTGSFTLPGGSS